MKKILLGFALFLPIVTSATTFPSSGIDYDTSTMTITGPTGTTCLTEDISSGYTFSLSDLGFSTGTDSLSTFGDWNNTASQCFQTLGDYTLEIELFDKAGNTLSLPQETIHITSATPDNSTSSFAVACAGNALANNSDICATVLYLRDQFGNGVEQIIPNINIYAPTTEASDDANLATTKFRAGLRVGASNFTLSSPLSFSWDINNLPTLNITALAPSIKELDIGMTTLATVVNRTIEFVINDINEINTDGSVAASTISFPSLSAALRFDVPIEIEPGFEQANIAFGEPVDMNNILDLPTATSIASVTSNFKSVSNHDFLDPANPPMGPLDETLTFPPVTDGDKQIVTRTIYATGPSDNPENISLVTTASYNLNGVAIKYPSGAIGKLIEDAVTAAGENVLSVVGWNTTGVGMTNIGISIEGIIIGDKDQMSLVGGDDNLMTALSSLHSMDIREEIVKNAYGLIRNASDIKTDPADFNWTLFNTQDIVVFDLSGQTLANATITLPATTLPTGKKTLIILNGNVIFSGDNSYANPATDSFGLILLRDEAGPEPVRGNIFVKDTVQKLNGTLFADGGFFSGNTYDLALANTDNASRAKQLRLIGTLFAKNTIGGSRRVDNGGNFYTPWGIDSDPLGIIAKRYDLHEVRRYNSDTNPSDCVMDGATCDPNDAAFILRVDNKMSLLPSPGFTTQ